VIAACDLSRMTTKIPEALDVQIERLIRQHLVAQQLAAKAAIERAFTSAAPAARPSARGRASYRRRPSTEVAELATRLLDAVRACPGETMTVIAARVGLKPRALHRPMTHLKDAGQVRSAGERNFTRYFPMGLAKSA
jgi:hypothetical protein